MSSTLEESPSARSVSEPSFSEFFALIRAGDEQAAAELVRKYEPALRLEIRLRLGDPKLRKLLEPADICQSVLGSFFVRAALGQFDLDSPEKLKALLLTMARNKVASQARRQQAMRRDHHRAVSLDDAIHVVAAGDPTPSRMIIGREMLQEFQGRLSEEELRMAQFRSQGMEWAAIASVMGGTAQGRRKQFARAANRVSRQIGLIEVGDA